MLQAHGLHKRTEIRQLREVAPTSRVVGVSEGKGGKGPCLTIQAIQSGMSLNRTHYPAAALKAAAPLYEGVRSFLDHNLWDSTVTKLAGSLDAATWDATAEAVVGTLYPAVELEAGNLLLNLAKAELRFRANGILSGGESLFGFSHVAYVLGEWLEDDEGEYYNVTQINEVESVDAVTFPAANGFMKGMSESRRTQLVGMLQRESTLRGLRLDKLVGDPQHPTPARRLSLDPERARAAASARDGQAFTRSTLSAEQVKRLEARDAHRNPAPSPSTATNQSVKDGQSMVRDDLTPAQVKCLEERDRRRADG